MLDDLRQPHKHDGDDQYEDPGTQYIVVVNNKIDKLVDNDPLKRKLPADDKVNDEVYNHSISCVSGEGLNELENLLIRLIKLLVGRDQESNVGGEAAGNEGILITRQRHRNHLQQCLHHLDRFLSCSLPMDAAAEELRYVSIDCYQC
jgi:tRNA U34 5-carboxymethylaminomethyl modifying GTPase MnmE/TrmE